MSVNKSLPIIVSRAYLPLMSKTFTTIYFYQSAPSPVLYFSLVMMTQLRNHHNSQSLLSAPQHYQTVKVSPKFSQSALCCPTLPHIYGITTILSLLSFAQYFHTDKVSPQFSVCSLLPNITTQLRYHHNYQSALCCPTLPHSYGITTIISLLCVAQHYHTLMVSPQFSQSALCCPIFPHSYCITTILTVCSLLPIITTIFHLLLTQNKHSTYVIVCNVFCIEGEWNISNPTWSKLLVLVNLTHIYIT